MKRFSLLAIVSFVAVGCAHQLMHPATSVKVVVNASPQVARQFDVAALQHMTELALSRVTLTNPRPIQLTVDIDLDSTDELFTIPHNRLKSGNTISWKAIFDGAGEPGYGDAGEQSADKIWPVTIRNEKSGQPVVVGSYAIVGEMGVKLDWAPIVLLANDPQFSGPRPQQTSIRSASRFLAERVRLADEALRLHEERQHSRP